MKSHCPLPRLHGRSHAVAALPPGAALSPLPSGRVLSNGAATPGAWGGDVSDLQVALRAGAGDGGARPVLVVSGALALVPGYNLQRVVEHSMVRSKDVLGMAQLLDLDAALLRSEAQVSQGWLPGG